MEAFLGKFWKEIRQFEWTWNWLIRTAFQDRKSYGRETSGSGNKIEQDMDNREKGKRKSREKEKRGGLPWWLSGKESACQCKQEILVVFPPSRVKGGHTQLSQQHYMTVCVRWWQPQRLSPELGVHLFIKSQSPRHVVPAWLTLTTHILVFPHHTPWDQATVHNKWHC